MSEQRMQTYIKCFFRSSLSSLQFVIQKVLLDTLASTSIVKSTLPHSRLMQQTTNWWYVSYFSQKTGFDIYSTICMKCQILFSGWAWLGVAKVSGIVRHRSVQLIWASSWAMPAILAAGKRRGQMLLFRLFLTFITVPFSSLSLSFISCTISSISFLPFSGRRHKMAHKSWRVVKLQRNQSNLFSWKNKKTVSKHRLLKIYPKF